MVCQLSIKPNEKPCTHRATGHKVRHASTLPGNYTAEPKTSLVRSSKLRPDW